MNRPAIARLSLAVIVSALLAGGASADSYDPVTVGARAEGMGGAAIAAAADLEAVAANPAGLLALSRPELTLGGRRLTDAEEVSSSASPTTTTTFHHLAVNLAGGACPLTVGGRALVLAAAYQRPLELVTHFRGEDIDGGVEAASAAAAIALNPWLGAGLAVNFWGGTRDFSHDLQDGSHLWWKSEYSGTNATFGLLADLRHASRARPWTFGLAVHTPFDLGIDYHELTTTPGAADRPDAWTYRVEMPWRVGVGATFEAAPRLLLAADVEWRAFGEKSIVATGAQGTVTSPLSSSGEDLVPVRLGVEYRLRAGTVTVPLRLGWRSVPPLRADSRGGAPDGQVVGSAVTAGTGIGAGASRFDLAWSRSDYRVDHTGAEASSTSRRTYDTVMLQGSVCLGR